ncbi:hypothetical protein PG996_013769 [Apiospora saccharicola]|uniref:Uncharacterized protein n=1 Tax=Apiospora saccharicola TaxID=335842 RepID=A0ABR1TGE0_9PEZI
MTVDRLEAAKFLYSRKESLATIDYIIDKKYSDVLKLSGDIVMVQDDVRDFLEKGKDGRRKRKSSQQERTISMSITINNADQEECHNFLWDLSHKSIRDKFKFDFDSALGSHSTTIEVDEFEAHHSIVKYAFSYLAGYPRNETKPIGEYLATWLPYHLKHLQRLEAEDKGELSAAEKRDIGTGLYNIFKSDDTFRRHQASFEGHLSYWTPREMREVNEWLTDSAVASRLDKQFLRSIKFASSPARGYMRPLVNLMLNQFLRAEESTWGASIVFRWIEQFVMVDTIPYNGGPDESDGSDDIDTGDIEWWRKVSIWCRDYLALQDSELESLWYERMGEAAVAMLPFRNTDEAILEFYRKAVGLPNPSWRSYKGLAEEEFKRGDFNDAIGHVGTAIDLAQSASPEDVIRLRLQVGDYHYYINEFDMATDYYFTAKETCPSDSVVLASKADMSYLRVQLRTLDAAATRKRLRDTLEMEESKARFV